MKSSYREALAGLVALPDLMERPILTFGLSLAARLRVELEKPSPDTHLIALLCDAARVGDELRLADQRRNQDRAKRDARQSEVYQWAVDTFGQIAVGRGERAARLLEEAIELAQVEGLPIEAVERLAEHVYDKPSGEPGQEVGGIAVCLLCYCEAAGLSAEAEEVRESNRVMSLPAEHFRHRQNAKAAAGVAERCEPEPEAAHSARLVGGRTPKVLGRGFSLAEPSAEPKGRGVGALISDKP